MPWWNDPYAYIWIAGGLAFAGVNLFMIIWASKDMEE